MERYIGIVTDIVGAIVGIGGFVLAAATLVWYHRLQEDEVRAEIDDNIMNFVDSTLGLIERVNQLHPEERELFVMLLKEWGYFKIPEHIKRRHYDIPKEETLVQIEEYFLKLAKQAPHKAGNP